jgi:hypothetical protein
MTGCEKLGYIITINSNHIRYNDLQQIGTMLEEIGFRALVYEGKEDKQKYRNGVYTVFEKKLADKHSYTVDGNITLKMYQIILLTISGFKSIMFTEVWVQRI